MQKQKEVSRSLVLRSAEMLAKAKCYADTDKITCATEEMETEILAKDTVDI
jgi:hypothetical protein